ncbi:MAG: ribosomal protein L7/L12 [Nannocystaceae bacterium]
MSTREEIEKHIGNGKKLMAIKVYRDITGLGLRESKDAVDAFIREGRWSTQANRALALPRRSATPQTPEVSLDSVVAYIQKQSKIGAIKELRQLTGLGLKESKEAVEMYMQQRRWPPSIAAKVRVEQPEATSATSKLDEAEVLARRGQKLRAIKALRSVVRVPLKEAKDAVESFMDNGCWPQSIHAGLAGSGFSRRAASLADLGGAEPGKACSSTTTAGHASATPTPVTSRPPVTTPRKQARPQQARPKPTRKPIDPEAAAAMAVLGEHLSGCTIDYFYAVKRDFMPGYLALVGDRGYFLTKRFSHWEVDGEFAKSEGVEAEVRLSFSQVTLCLRAGFLPHTFTGLDEATAKKVVAILSPDS